MTEGCEGCAEAAAGGGSVCSRHWLEPDPEAVERRRHLIARMAGNIAAGMVRVRGLPGDPSPMATLATTSVAIARAILEEIDRAR